MEPTKFESAYYAECAAQKWNAKHRNGKATHQWTQVAQAEQPIGKEPHWFVHIVHYTKDYHIKWL